MIVFFPDHTHLFFIILLCYPKQTCFLIFWAMHLFELAVKCTRQIVGISLGTYCVPLVAGCFCFGYERDTAFSPKQ